MDIICARCGKHFSGIEAAREHRGNCRETSKGEPIHWVPAQKSKITPVEWESLMRLINTQNPSSSASSANIKPAEIQSEKTKDSADNDNQSSPSSGPKRDSRKTASMKNKNAKRGNFRVPIWVIALLLIFALSISGLGISLFVGSFIPFWILFGFSLIYSIEKWFSYQTRRHKFVGKLYRVLLNLMVLATLGLLIWSGIKLFSQQFTQSSLFGSLIFLGEFIFFIWIWKIVSKNSWRWPSMKLTVFSLLSVSVIFAFAGVQPMSSYKDTVITKWDTYWAEQEIKNEERLAQAKIDEQKRIEEQKTISEHNAATPIPSPIIPKVVEIIPTVPLKTLTIEEVEKEAFNLINQEREKVGLTPTVWDDNLYSLSKAHTEEMASRGELFHTPMGASYAENAWGASWGGINKKDLATRMVNSWMSSPLHRAWILHIPLKTSVVSIVDDNRGQYASWTFRFVGDGGPPLIQKAYDLWMSETGGGIPWLTWLYDIKGYPSDTSWLIP